MGWLNLQIPDELHKKLRVKSVEDGVDMGVLIEEAIRDLVEEEDD